MKHQATIKRLREMKQEKAAGVLVDAFMQATTQPVNDEVLRYQKELKEELAEEVTSIKEHVDSLKKSMEDVLEGVDNIPQTDLSAIREGFKVLANQIAAIDTTPVVNIPEVNTEVPIEPLVEAVKGAFPEDKSWTFTVKRDKKGFITEVVAT